MSPTAATGWKPLCRRHLRSVAGAADSGIAPAKATKARIRFLGGETLTETRPPRRFSIREPAGLWASAGGQSYAISGEPGIEAFRGADRSVSALAGRPLSGMSPADLATVNTALLSPAPGSAARPFLELLRDVLTHRFGTEVAIGPSRTNLAADDIALSSQDPPTPPP